MNIPSPRATKRARIEIIPLIDIIFFLLATFVMVSLSMVKNQGVVVNVPTAASGEKQERDDAMTISVTADGQYFLDKTPVSLAEIQDRVGVMKSVVENPRIFIRGDTKAEFGKAVALLDQLRLLGISRIAIDTRQP